MNRRLSKCERGNSVIEIALIAPVLATLLIGMVDISRGVSEKLKLTQIAQRSTERVQRGYFNFATDLPVLDAEAEAAAGTGSAATVTAWLECGTNTARLAYDSSCAPGTPTSRFVSITITKSFTPMFPVRWAGANANGTYTLIALSGVRVQ